MANICPTGKALTDLEVQDKLLELEEIEATVKARVGRGYEAEDLFNFIGLNIAEQAVLQKRGAHGPNRLQNYVRNVQEKIAQGVSEGLHSESAAARTFFKVLHGFANDLPKSYEYTAQRASLDGGLTLNELAKMELGRYTNRILNPDGKLTDKQVGDMTRKIGNYMLGKSNRPELATEVVSFEDLSPREKLTAETLRLSNNVINDINYALGGFSKETWEAHKDNYLAALYDVFELDPKMGDYIKKNRALEIGMYKETKEVDDFKIEHLIRDPVAATMKRLEQTLSNVTKREFFDFLGRSGIAVDEAKPAYEQVPDAKIYGSLKGKWIPKEIMEDMKGFWVNHEGMQSLLDFINWYGHSKPRQFLKRLFTVWNPSVRLGNRLSNFLFAGMSGMNPVSFGADYTKRLSQMKKIRNLETPGDASLLRYMKDGLIGFEASKDEKRVFMERAQEYFKDHPEKNFLLKKADEFFTKQAQAYRQIDDAAKAASMDYWLNRKKVTYEEALRRTRQAFQDYRTVGFFYKNIGSQIPVFGNAFVQFQADALRMMKNSALEHPVAAVSMLSAWWGLTYAMSALSGETEEDRKTREGRPGAPHVPFLRIPLAVQTPWGEVNAARLMGLYGITPLGGDILGSDLSRLLPLQIPELKTLGSDPLIGPLIAAFGTDTDFRGKPIADPKQSRFMPSTMTAGEKLQNQLTYVGRAYLPPTLKDAYDIVQAAQGNPDYYGRTKTVTQALLRAYPGIKAEVFGPEQAMELRQKARSAGEARIDATERQVANVKNQLVGGEIARMVQDGRITREAGVTMLQKRKLDPKWIDAEIIRPDQAINRIHHLNDDIEEFSQEFPEVGDFFKKYNELLIKKEMYQLGKKFNKMVTPFPTVTEYAGTTPEELREFIKLDHARKQIKTLWNRIDQLMTLRKGTTAGVDKQRLDSQIEKLQDQVDLIVAKAMGNA